MVVCNRAHSLHFMPVAASYNSSLMASWPWVICHHFSYLLLVFLIWNESREILLAFLHCSSVSLAFVCPREEEKVKAVYCSEQFTAVTEVKYEKWFSFPRLLLFYFLLSISEFFNFTLSLCLARTLIAVVW